MSQSVKNISLLKHHWKIYLQEKNITNLLSLYDENCLFKGTLAAKVVHGKKNMTPYFKNFTKDVYNVRFLAKPTTIFRGGMIIEGGKYNFYTKKAIINANYQFIVDSKTRKIISHYSSLI